MPATSPDTCPAVIDVDIGTSSSKGVLVDLDGQLLVSSVVEHAVQRPGPGMVEMDGSVWWEEYVPQEIRAQPIGASYGAAFLAGQLVASVSIDAWNPVQETVTPRPEAVEQYEGLYGLYRDLYPRTADTVHALAARQER